MAGGSGISTKVTSTGSAPSSSSRGLQHGRLVGRRQAGRRDEQGLLEVRTVQRVRLIEDCEGVELAVNQKTLDRHFGSRDKLLDEDCPGRSARVIDLFLVEYRPHATNCLLHPGGRVRADPGLPRPKAKPL